MTKMLNNYQEPDLIFRASVPFTELDARVLQYLIFKTLKTLVASSCDGREKHHFSNTRGQPIRP